MQRITQAPELPIRSYAHLGDSVYELFIREKTVRLTQNPKKMHMLTVALVNARYQADLLEQIKDFLSEKEADMVRRARNLSVTTARRTDHKVHRLSTAFEVLVGYLYVHNKERLQELYEVLNPIINTSLEQFKLENSQENF